MSTLLLRFAAPLQSWGLDAKFERRGTELIPTKSGVIGLVAAALGRKRDKSLKDLEELIFGVRVDQPGVLLRDYHTAKSAKSSYVTNRYYLSDAVFLVGLEGGEELLNEVANAVCFPVFPLFLGRRSCPPEGNVLVGIRKGKNILDALKEEPWQSSEWMSNKEIEDVALRIVIDSEKDSENTYYQRDVPISFSQLHRKFGFRRVEDFGMQIISNLKVESGKEVIQTTHDPFQELGKEG